MNDSETTPSDPAIPKAKPRFQAVSVTVEGATPDFYAHDTCPRESWGHDA
jgi:hypothetical protein